MKARTSSADIFIPLLIFLPMANYTIFLKIQFRVTEKDLKG